MALKEKVNKIIAETHQEVTKQKDFKKLKPWDLRTILYDNAIRIKWDERVERPFIHNAKPSQLTEVLHLCEDLKKEPALLTKMKEKSENLRKGAT